MHAPVNRVALGLLCVFGLAFFPYRKPAVAKYCQCMYCRNSMIEIQRGWRFLIMRNDAFALLFLT